MYSDYPSDWDFAPIAEFADRLPKVETHLHLEGALPYRMLQELEPERFPKTPSFWKEDFRHESFEAFDRTLLDHATAWFTSVERYREAAKAVFEELKTQNVRYVETSFHLGILEFLRDATGPEIISAIKSAIPEGMEVRIFAGITRDLYQSEMREIIDDLHRWEELDGIDLHGRETLPMEDWKREVWQRNREAGKVTKAHAGEFGGAENVRYVIEELGVKRVQHGVRAVEDPAVLELAREKGVVFDLCPISNWRLQVVPTLCSHPIRDLIESGIVCTVSTDDPMIFGNCLADEYLALAVELGFSIEEMAKVAADGFEVASISAEQRAGHLKEIEDLLAEFQ